MNQSPHAPQCCCNWGLMLREDGFPEFPCWDCPRHGGPDSVMGSVNERCKRHAKHPVDIASLKALLGVQQAEVDAAIESIRKDAS